MRLRAGNHRASASAKSFTVAVMAAATIAQLLSISHEMTVRHFRCAEHGELTHVVALMGSAAEVAVQRTSDAVSAQQTDAPDAHEHCGVAFTIEGSSCTPSTSAASSAVTHSPVPHPVVARIALGGRAGVLASAPKTSPPSA